MDSNLLYDYLNKSGKTKTHMITVLNVSRPTFDRILSVPANASYQIARKLQKELSIPDYDMDPIFLP